MMDSLTNLLICFTTVYVMTYTYFYFRYKYWERKKFPFLKPKFPLGNSTYFIKKTKNVDLESMRYYDDIKKRGLKFAGIYTILRPVLVIIDPDYIKDILVTDFNNFTDRGHYYNEKGDPISAHLFALDGKDWKNMRAHLSPTFTSGKMKTMFPIVLNISDVMVKYINKFVASNEDIKLRECLAKFTTDVIGSCAFGLEANSFKNPDATFLSMGKKIFEVKNLKHLLDNLIIAYMPDLAKKLGLKASRTDVTEMCTTLVKRTIKYREDNNQYRSDFLQLLMDMAKKGVLTLEQLVAQVFVFFLAGFDTSTTSMNFALYELARNPEIQERLRDEINDVLGKYNGQITYENIKEMQYLQQVLDEILRIYPTLPNLQRVCVNDYKLRDTDLIIEKGTSVLIPIISLQRDPDLYSEPEKFDPDRFHPDNKNSRKAFTHIPFGEGPRKCIGLRFGLMQSKIGVVTILKNFRVKLSGKMKKPLTLDPRYFLLTTKETLYVTMEKI